MSDAITEEKYDAEVDEQGAWLLESATESASGGGYDTTRQAVLDGASDSLHGHQWFARDYYGAGLYGSIIEHSDADPGQYSDWPALTESNTPEEAVKRIAYFVFEADVIEDALDKSGGEPDEDAAASALGDVVTNPGSDADTQL